LYSESSYAQYLPDELNLNTKQARYPPARPPVANSRIGLDLRRFTSVTFEESSESVTLGSGVSHVQGYEALKVKGNNGRVIAGQVWGKEESIVEYAVNGGFGHHSRCVDVPVWR
jgi:hypothetical protein